MSQKNLKIGDVIALKSYHGKHLVVEKTGDLNANRQKIGSYERFVVQDATGSSNPRDVKFGETITLFCQHCKYVVAELDGTANGNRSSIGHWEQWKIFDPTNLQSKAPIPYKAKIVFKSYHGKYIVAEQDGTANADRSSIGNWEKWELLEGNQIPENVLCIGDRIGLKSTHGKFLVAEQDGTLNAHRSALRGWERFSLQATNGSSAPRQLNYGDTVSLYSHHGKYMVAEQDGNANANRSNIGSWEKWELVNPSNPSSTAGIYYDDKVAFRSHHQTYLVAETDGTANANRTHIGQWEQWKIKTTKRYILRNELNDILNTQLAGKFTNDFKLYLADDEYYCPTPNDAHTVIRKTSVEQMNYIAERFDCDDFAHLLKAEFIKDGYNNGVRRSAHCFGIIWAGSHAFNWMINDDKNIRFIEPQNDTIFYPDTVKDIWFMLA